MSQEFIFDNHHDFLKKWVELVNHSKIPKEQITLYAPHPVHGLDDIIQPKRSVLRFFTFFAGLTGLLTGIFFPIYTVFSWKLNSGGKPPISLPAFIVIGFELTVLLGGTISFLGFLILSRLPNIRNMVSPREYGNHFVIVVREKGEQ